MSMNQQEEVPPMKWQVRGPLARNGFICEWEDTQHTGRTITGSHKKFRLNQIKEYELRSLNENPSFDQGKNGWVPDGGEIILAPNNNDLAGGKNALTLKKPAGYGRLGTANKINLKAGKKYRTIIVLTDEIDIPRAAGDCLVQYSGGVVMGNDTYTTYHSGGKTILDQVISFPEDGSFHFQYALFTKEQITFEHFFIVEERNTTSATANSPEAAAAIEAAIRKAAGKPTGELTQADLVKVTELDLNRKQLTDVSALAGLKNLKSLNLYGNPIADVSPLAGLTKLEELQLGYCQITNLKPLMGLKQLTHLYLQNNKGLTKSEVDALRKQLPPKCNIWENANANSPEAIAAVETAIRKAAGKPTGELTKADLDKATRLVLTNTQLTEIPTGLEKLEQLTELHLADNQLTNTKGLEKLTQLTYLNLYGNQLTNIDELRNLTQLEILALERNRLTQVKALENLTQLGVMNIGFNQLTNVTGLENLKQLTELQLYQNQITDVTGLQNLTQLEVLNLEGSQLAEVKWLEKLTKLNYLNLNFTKLTDLRVLEKLDQLTELQFAGNQLTDLKGLEKLTQLEVLFAADNQLTNVKELEKLTKLKRLFLYGNQLTDIKLLENHTQLQALDLSGNQLTDVSPLESLTKLEFLALNSNRVTDVSPLEALTKLEELSLKDNPALTKAKIDQLQKALPNCKITHNATK